MSDLLSPEAERFLRERVPTVLHLDVLLLLQSDPRRSWGAAAVASALRASVESVGRILEEIATANLLEVRIAGDVMYRFAPWEASIGAIVEEISARHFSDRDAIVARFGSSRQSEVARRFAEAFRFPGRKHDG